jgi:hypothetical protein
VSTRRLSTRWGLVCITAVCVFTSVNAAMSGDLWLALAGVPIIALGIGILVRESAATRRR